MSEKLKEFLGEEVYKGLVEKIGKNKFTFDVYENESNFIPKTRLNEVIAERDAFKTQVSDYETKVTEFGKTLKDHEELKTNFDNLQNEYTTSKTKFETDLVESKKTYALNEQLLKHKARNIDAVRAIVPTDQLKYDTEKGYTNFDDVIKTVKEANPYLFEGAEQKADPKKIGSTSTSPDDKPKPTTNAPRSWG